MVILDFLVAVSWSDIGPFLIEDDADDVNDEDVDGDGDLGLLGGSFLVRHRTIPN